MTSPWPPAPPAGQDRTRAAAAPATGGRGAGWRLLAVFLVAEVTLLLVSFLVLVPRSPVPRSSGTGSWGRGH